jgi:RHS repeat-associated protein
VVALSSPQAAVEKTYRVNPFGGIRRETGASVNKRVFTGHVNDSSTGLIYMNARYYDPDAGRFLTQDSFLGASSAPPSLNRYLYAYGNPGRWVDPTGHCVVDERGACVDEQDPQSGGEVPEYDVATGSRTSEDGHAYVASGSARTQRAATKSQKKTSANYITKESRDGSEDTQIKIMPFKVEVGSGSFEQGLKNSMKGLPSGYGAGKELSFYLVDNPQAPPQLGGEKPGASPGQYTLYMEDEGQLQQVTDMRETENYVEVEVIDKDGLRIGKRYTKPGRGLVTQELADGSLYEGKEEDLDAANSQAKFRSQEELRASIAGDPLMGAVYGTAMAMSGDPETARRTMYAAGALGMVLGAGKARTARGGRYTFDVRTGQFRDMTSGRFVSPRNLPWPGNRGFASSTQQTLKPGTIIDRFGKPSGRYGGQPGASVSQRGMAAGTEGLPYTQYRVVKPIGAEVGPAAPVPEFGASGGATQYLFRKPIGQMVSDGILEVVK